MNHFNSDLKEKRQTSFYRVFIPLIPIAAFAYCMQPISLISQEQPSHDTLAMGKKLFTKYCISCHGADGEGNTPLGKAIPNMVNFTDPSMKDKSDEVLLVTIANGKPPMPSFGQLSQQQREDLVSYIRTFAPNEGNE